MDDVSARLRSALILGYEGDFLASLSALTELITRYPESLEVRYELAMTQFLLGMVDEGCGNLKMILEVDPSHERALQQSAYC